MSIQESSVSVHSETPDIEHVDSPQPGPIHSVAKEVSVAPATELPDATEAIVDVSPEPEESSPISLKDNVHELVEDAITKDVPGQVERDASIVTVEDFFIAHGGALRTNLAVWLRRLTEKISTKKNLFIVMQMMLWGPTWSWF